MMVYFALAERRGFLLDQYNPELIAAVDEGTVEDNPGCYDEQIERARGLLGRRHVGGPGTSRWRCPTRRSGTRSG